MNGRLGQAICLALAALLPLAPEKLAAGGSDSIKAGKKVSLPLGGLAVPAPVFCLGTRVQRDQAPDRGMVAFSSDVGQLSRVDYIRLEPAAIRVVAEGDRSSRLALYHEQLETFVAANSAGLTAAEPLELDGADMLFALVELPGAAVVESVVVADGRPIRHRQDSIRGLLLFARGEFLYLLQHEVGVSFDAVWPCGLERKSGPHLSPEERTRAAREGLESLYRTITFTGR